MAFPWVVYNQAWVGHIAPGEGNAVTLWEVIATECPNLSPRMYAHERRHVWQTRLATAIAGAGVAVAVAAYGASPWWFAAAPCAFYVWYFTVGTLIGAVRGDAYRLNPAEIDARRAGARDATP